MKYFFLILLIILLGVNLYFSKTQSEELTFQKSRDDQSSKKMWQDPELSEGMEKMLQKKQQLESDASSRDRDDPEEFVDEMESDPRAQLPNIDQINLQKQGRADEIKATQKVYRQDMKILAQEIEFEERILAQLERSGDTQDIPMMREKIGLKKAKLDYLRKNPPEEGSYEQ